MVHGNTLLDDLPERDRVPFWRDVVCTHLYRVTPEPWPDAATFRGRWDVRDCGRFGLVEVSSVNPRRLRRAGEIARDGFDDIIVQQVMSDNLTISFGTEQFHLRAGDFCIYALDWPHDITASGGIGLRSLEIPRAHLSPLLAHGEPRRPRQVSGHSPLGELLAGGLISAWSQVPNLSSDLGEAVLRNLGGLVALVCGASSDGRDLARDGAHSLRLQAAMTCVKQRLAEPDLSPERVAVALGVSVRSLHMLFHHTGESFAKYVMRLRLEACRATLESPEGVTRSIADIAFGWGFGSLPAFYRAFAAAFSLAPSELRQEVRRRTAR